MTEINTNVWNGTGRRKCATARVRLVKGNGTITINQIDIHHYLQYSPGYIQYLKEPLSLISMVSEVDIQVNVNGGGIAGQTGAIRLGIARALCKLNSDYRNILKLGGCLTRDARIVERKKYGLKKARKAPQYSKR
uniref:ribosomal protein S9 n=1 Tax=Chroothece richteriana TaxID=101928 RepID=UPI001FCD0788|nr:ribosomal protein S9 [Chroothece richteriana]UNJ14194.1 ribosomal protein S9 [Chroothece richteriana]